MDNVPDAAIAPQAILGLYFFLIISGAPILVKVTAAAMVDPFAAPKTAEANIVASSRPPGDLPNNFCMASYKVLAIPLL